MRSESNHPLLSVGVIRGVNDMSRSVRGIKQERRAIVVEQIARAKDWREVLCPPALSKKIAQNQRLEAERKKAMEREGFR